MAAFLSPSDRKLLFAMFGILVLATVADFAQDYAWQQEAREVRADNLQRSIDADADRNHSLDVLEKNTAVLQTALTKLNKFDLIMENREHEHNLMLDALNITTENTTRINGTSTASNGVSS